MDFFEGLFKDMVFSAAIEASRKPNGKPDTYEAAGMAYGLLGDFSLDDMALFCAMLGSQDAFDDDW